MYRDISDVEHSIYRSIRNDMKRDNRTGFHNDFATIQQEYFNIYNSYLQDLLINLIGYENAPKTLDQRFLEWQLRMFGVCAIAVHDKNHIGLLNARKEGNNPYWNGVTKLGMFGYLTAPTKQQDPFTPGNDNELELITPLNYEDLDRGYIVVPNKFNFYFNYGFNGITTDFEIILRVAKTLSLLKANEIMNSNQMRQQYTYFVKNGNLTGKNIIEQINNGVMAIGVDSDATDINSLVQLNNYNVQNYLPALKEAWNSELDELLTQLGINTVGVDKKERLVANEAAANAQLTEASANIYIQARQEQIDLINEVAGTDIQVTFNQQAYKELVQMGSIAGGEDDASENDSANNE